MRHYTGALEALVRIAGHAEEEGRVHAVRCSHALVKQLCSNTVKTIKEGRVHAVRCVANLSEAYSCMRPSPTIVCGLKLLVYAALSY
jgi:hypothetical protein